MSSFDFVAIFHKGRPLGAAGGAEMTVSENLAEFVVRSSHADLSARAREQLKMRVLDSLGCAMGALGERTPALVLQQVREFGGSPLSTLIGGEKTSPDRAALYNGALVRYLDFNDSYLAPGETCHPSDNLAPVLAAGEYAGADGKTLLAALAVAYQVQCRLSDEAPVRAKGFDHTTQGSYAVACGVAKALGLDKDKTANAIGIAGAGGASLRVTRTGRLSNWKGLAYPNTAFLATHAAFLAMRGVTGPIEVFEGNKGFCEAIAGDFYIDWEKEDLERVTRTIIKKYNAEVHSQSALEGIIELKKKEGFGPEDVERIEIDVFDVAYHIIGGGEEGEKTTVKTKEEADHSLPYLAATAAADGTVMPVQYAPDKIERAVVRELMKRVVVTPADDLTSLFPEKHACRVRVFLKEGRKLSADKTGYQGFHTSPMDWPALEKKFNALAAPAVGDFLRSEIVEAAKNLEDVTAAELMGLLARCAEKRTKETGT